MVFLKLHRQSARRSQNDLQFLFLLLDQEQNQLSFGKLNEYERSKITNKPKCNSIFSCFDIAVQSVLSPIFVVSPYSLSLSKPFFIRLSLISCKLIHKQNMYFKCIFMNELINQLNVFYVFSFNLLFPMISETQLYSK